MWNTCGNQNLLLLWKAWPGGGLNCVERCNELGNDYRCILICMFACWKKFCYAALTAKTFANFAPFLDPKMEVLKWTQKWCQNLTPKMGSKNGTQKGGPIFFWLEKDLQEIKAKFKILGLPFWVPFLDLILVVKFWHHFWVHFKTSILGSKNGANFAKVFAVKAA